MDICSSNSPLLSGRLCFDDTFWNTILLQLSIVWSNRSRASCFLKTGAQVHVHSWTYLYIRVLSDQAPIPQIQTTEWNFLTLENVHHGRKYSAVYSRARCSGRSCSSSTLTHCQTPRKTQMSISLRTTQRYLEESSIRKTAKSSKETWTPYSAGQRTLC